MKCPRCDKECSEDMIICPNCGKKIARVPVLNIPNIEIVSEDATEDPTEDPVHNEKSKDVKKSEKYRFLKLCLSVIGVLLVLLLVKLTLTKKESDDLNFILYSKDSIDCWFRGDNNQGAMIYYTDKEGNIISVTSDEKQINSCFDYSTVCIIDENNDLYLIQGTEGTKISGNVIDFAISADATSLSYLVNEKHEALSGTLYLYDSLNKKSTQIANDVRSHSIVISPNGDSYAFIRGYKDKEDYDLCVSLNGKDFKTLDKQKCPIAISNHGKYLYYGDKNGIYVMSDEKEQFLTSNYQGKLYFNYDYTEVLFNEDKQSFISIAGAEKQQFSDQRFVSMIQPNDITCEGYLVIENNILGTVVRNTYGVHEFKNKAYFLNPDYEPEASACYYIDSNWIKHKLFDITPDNITISGDGKKLMYLYQNELYCIDDLTVKNPEAKVIASNLDTYDYTANIELTDLYYINNSKVLFYMNNEGENTKIAENVQYYRINQCNYDDRVYFIEENENKDIILYDSIKGNEKNKINEGKDLVLGTRLTVLFYYISGEDGNMHQYILENGESKQFLEELNL